MENDPGMRWKLEDVKMEAIKKANFWGYWQDELIRAGYPEPYIKEEIQRYMSTGKEWERGENDFKRVILNYVILPAISFKRGE